MELNVKCDSTSTWGTFSPWLWQVLLCCPHFFVPWSCRLQVCPRVSYSLPCYMGDICGLHFYYHLGRLCAVFTVQKKAIDNFVVAQGSWKADIHSSSQEVPSFNGKWTFLPELKNACHCEPLWHHTMLFFFMIGCHPSHRCKCYCCRSSKFSFYWGIKLFWLDYGFCFLHLAVAVLVSEEYCSLYT